MTITELATKLTNILRSGPKPEPKPERVYVVARNIHQFEDWCETSGINPRDPRRASYISTPDRLRGISCHEEDIVFLDGWTGNRSTQEIDNMVRNACFAARLGAR